MQNHFPPLQTAALTVLLMTTAGHAVADDPVFFSWKRHHASSASPAPSIPSSGTTATYTYCPQPGGGHGWGLGGSNTYVHDVWDEMDASSLPIALLMRDRNSPWGSGPTWDLYDMTYPSYGASPTPAPSQLADAVVDRALAGGQLHYVLADIEAHSYTNTQVDTWMSNIMDIVTGSYPGGVTGDPDGTGSVNISQSTIQAWDTVWVGNYSMHRYPKLSYSGTTTRTDITAPWLGNAQDPIVTGRHNTFVDQSLNVLMPVTYAYAAHVRHANVSHWSGNISPTVRAAYLWSGIERHSSAVREELTFTGTLSNKKVIPWVTPFANSGGVDPQTGTYAGCWMPPSADFLATIKHLRLRGADGFYFWAANDLEPGGYMDTRYWSATDGSGTPLNPWYSSSEEWADSLHSPNGYDWFEANALISWEELDGDFEDTALPYRYDTDKTSGVVVSAMNDMGRLNILVSYMKTVPGGTGALVDMDTYFPEARDYSSGTNQYISCTSYSHVYSQDFFTPDIDGDFDADSDDASAWVALYSANDPRADWNQDGIYDANDISLFVNAASLYP